MLYLKKYFTEGLIQVAILLSLCGVRVDVGTHLPSWQEMIMGPSSALTQTQFHNLRNRLDGYGLHPKSVDLDGFFTARRLLGWVRSLDRLQIPGAELETWLVQSETNVLTGGPGQPSTLQGAGLSGLEVQDEGGESSLRASTVGEGPGSGYGPPREENVLDGGMLSASRDLEEDYRDYVTVEDADVQWPAPIHHGLDQTFETSLRSRSPPSPPVFPLDEEGEEEEEEEEMAAVNWSAGAYPYDRANRELAQELSEQFASLQTQSSMSLQECLRLLEDTFPLSPESQLPEEEGLEMRGGMVDHPSPGTEPLLSPLLPHVDPMLDLEEQWQDLLDIMEPEDMDVDPVVAPSFPGGGTDDTPSADHRPNPVQQDVYLHQASLPIGPQEGFGPLRSRGNPQEPPHSTQPALLTQPPNPLESLNISTNARDSLGYETTGDPMISDLFLEEDEALPSPLASLLDDSAMFDEISLLDLALVEGFRPALASHLEDELDSDSGLSLNFSHSPASPSLSEASYSSSSSSSSSSSASSASTAASLFSEEGAVGYSSDVEAEGEVEGAMGGYTTDLNKICPMSYQDPDSFIRLPQLQHVDHDHTYNQQRSTTAAPTKTQKGPLRPHYAKPYDHGASDRMWGRDERRARSLKIPFSNECIVNLPVEEFNDLLAKHRLTDSQLTLVRDIRRRGKNKMAAQNCRRRKLDILLDLEQGVSGLRRHRARLLREKTEVLRSVHAMKQRVSSLYQEVFSRLRDEEGRPLAATEYMLQFGSDGQVSVAPRHQGLAAERNHRPSKKQGRRNK